MLAVKEYLRTHIRWLIRRDYPEVLATEAATFEFAWTEDDLLRCLRQRNCIGMVAEHGDRVVGYMIYEMHKNHLKVLNFAVDPACRRRGVGRQMADKLIGKLSGHRRIGVALFTREGNLPSQLFWKAMGFRAVGVTPAYYEDSGEAGYRFVYRLPVDCSPFD